jgi:hypothetical protein
MKNVLFLLVILISVSCIKTIPDGRIPSEYLEAAKKYQKTYSAVLRGKSGSLTIRLIGNKPQVSVSGFHAGDILNEDCRSDIGDLTHIEVLQSKQTGANYVSMFAFRIDRGNCLNSNARRLVFSFSSPEKNLPAEIYIQNKTKSPSSSFPSTASQGFKNALKKKAGH